MDLARVLFVLAAVTVAGCATDVPSTRAFPPSTQFKLRATHHWDLVAADIAAHVRQRLAAVAPGAPVYLVAPEHRSPFELALHDFVTTRLVNDGVPVVLARAPGALRVVLDTQLVHNISPRATAVVPLTALVAGVMVAYNVAEHASHDFVSAAALGAAAAYDVGTQRFVRAGAPSKTELIVTTSVENSAQYLMRKTDVYYIDDADMPLFASPPPTRVFRVEGAS